MSVSLDVIVRIEPSSRISPGRLLCPVAMRGLYLDRLAKGGPRPKWRCPRITALDPDSGAPLVFDEDAEGDARFDIPCRFDPDYEGQALPLAVRRGTLVWPARTDVKTQRFRVTFDETTDSAGAPPRTIVGDGDMVVQREGRLAVGGMSRPIEYGDRLFGRSGLLVGSYKDLRFFEDVAPAAPLPTFREVGRVLDAEGLPISGEVFVTDFDGDGLLDMLACRHEGDVRLYRNEGTDESPVFRDAGGLRHVDGSFINMRDYLWDVEVPVRLRDGSEDPSRMMRPVASHYFPVTCVLVDWAGEGRQDLLVAAYRWIYFFQRRGDAFERGVRLDNEDRSELEPGPFLCLRDWNADGRADLLVGDYHGHVKCVEFRGMAGGLPTLRDAGPLEADGRVLRDIEYSRLCAVDWRGTGEGEVLVGNFYGEILRYRRVGRHPDGRPELERVDYLRAENAYATRYMEPSLYVDVNADGRRHLLSGDIKGGVFMFRNIGTNRKPVFEACRQLRDESGPIKVQGGPDPNSPDDGYSKPALCFVSGQDAPDLLVSSGLGRVWYFERRGADEEGYPLFARGEVLRDKEGAEIRCNHMSSVEVADWDYDGLPDILLGGQRNVHGLEDDDPDETSQVRWYRGVGRDAAGRLQFAPYVAMTAEGDGDINFRPKPRVIDWQGEEVLRVSGRLFRRQAGAAPHELVHVHQYPVGKAQGRESFLSADYTFSELAPGDPLVLVASCIGMIYAFREAFILNGGYLAADFEARGLLVEPAADTAPAATPRRRVEIRVPLLRAQPPLNADYDDPAWRDATERRDFYHLATLTHGAAGAQAEGPTATRLRIGRDEEALHVIVCCGEPEMGRIVAQVDHDNGLLEQVDAHVTLTLDPDPAWPVFHRWVVNPCGFRREYNVERETRLETGPWVVGPRIPTRVATRWGDAAHVIQLAIPFEKLGAAPERGARWCADFFRLRKVYSTAVRANEQAISELTRWLRSDPPHAEEAVLVFD